ncbi:MAG: SCO family protein [Rhodospirillaceae bacterium]|nr:SCO family protein [Rhodospirillaceae bacterium]
MSRTAKTFAAVLIVTMAVIAGVFLRHAVEEPRGVSVSPAVKPFSLTDQSGRPVTEASYRGRWLLLFFGFIRCPDVCPTSMLYAADLLKALGAEARNLQIAFVTVDPERDTPAVLRDYLANFDPRLAGLTGSPEQISAVTKAFGAYYAKRALEGLDDYTMDHSTAFYLVNADGKFQRAFALNDDSDGLTDELRAAMSAASPAQKE